MTNEQIENDEFDFELDMAKMRSERNQEDERKYWEAQRREQREFPHGRLEHRSGFMPIVCY